MDIRPWAPVLSDLGRCRCALAIWPGGEAPDRLLEHYAATSNRSLVGLEYWDTLSAALTVQHGGGWIAMLRDLNGAVDEDLIRERSTSFMQDALRRARLL